MVCGRLYRTFPFQFNHKTGFPVHFFCERTLFLGVCFHDWNLSPQNLWCKTHCRWGTVAFYHFHDLVSQISIRCVFPPFGHIWYDYITICWRDVSGKLKPHFMLQTQTPLNKHVLWISDFKCTHQATPSPRWVVRTAVNPRTAECLKEFRQKQFPNGLQNMFKENNRFPEKINLLDGLSSLGARKISEYQ